MNNNFKELLGKTIEKIILYKPYYQIMCIVLKDKKELWYHTQSDCCDVCFFSDIEGVQYLLDATVRSIKELPIKTQNGTLQEVDLVYGYKFITNKGYATITFRDSSNGYYAGYMDCCKPEELKTYLKHDIPIEILEDWSL